ncbi:hypothetical protein MRX96_026990 [Rhipicephalus microplus]
MLFRNAWTLLRYDAPNSLLIPTRSIATSNIHAFNVFTDSRVLAKRQTNPTEPREAAVYWEPVIGKRPETSSSA